MFFGTGCAMLYFLAVFHHVYPCILPIPWLFVSAVWDPKTAVWPLDHCGAKAFFGPLGPQRMTMQPLEAATSYVCGWTKRSEKNWVSGDALRFDALPIGKSSFKFFNENLMEIGTNQTEKRWNNFAETFWLVEEWTTSLGSYFHGG